MDVVCILCLVAKTLVIQKEKSHLQSELERANKELAAQHGKAVSCKLLLIGAYWFHWIICHSSTSTH